MMMEVRTGFAMLAALLLVVLTTGEIASQEIARIGANATCPAPGWALEEEVSFASDPELGLTGPAMATRLGGQAVLFQANVASPPRVILGRVGPATSSNRRQP